MIWIWARLRQRKLVQWVAAYVAVAWALLQLLGLLVESYDWPHVVMHVGFAVAVLGLAIACVLAWYHGERGAQKISGPELLILAFLLAIGGALMWRSQTRERIVVTPQPVSAVPAPMVPAIPAIPDKSIAVLPFENLSGRAEDAYLADGLQEEILNALARVRDLKVISRTSAQEYQGKSLNIREIAKRLGVRTVLEGSVRLQGQTLRLTIQLIDARDDIHLLATNYDRKLTNVLDLQTTVARLVANALSATLTRYEHGEFERIATNSGDAYDRYLHAVALFQQPAPGDENGLIEPKRLLEEALTLDPDYADALAMLSQVNTWNYFSGIHTPAAGTEAKRDFERAFALEPNLPEARMARGLYAIYVTKDLDQAISDLDAVVSVRPNSAEAHQLLGLALRRRGSMTKALEHFTRAWDLDPLNPALDGGPIITLLGLRRYPEAIEQTHLDRVRFPGSPSNYFVRARLQGYFQHSIEPLRMALREQGSLLSADELQAVEAEVAQSEGRYLDAIRLCKQIHDKFPVAQGKRIGLLFLAAGDAAKAHQEFLHAEQYAAKHVGDSQGPDTHVELALVQSLLGQNAAALATIDQIQSRFPEATDRVNGPQVSFARSIILVRAGRLEEGHAEAERLLKVPFGAPISQFSGPEDGWNLLPEAKDPIFDELINHPPRL